MQSKQQHHQTVQQKNQQMQQKQNQAQAAQQQGQPPSQPPAQPQPQPQAQLAPNALQALQALNPLSRMQQLQVQMAQQRQVQLLQVQQLAAAQLTAQATQQQEPQLSQVEKVAIDKIAPLVAKLGESFAEQMREQHGSDAMYAFLQEGDSPARKYYLQKLELARGNATASDSPNEAQRAKPQQAFAAELERLRALNRGEEAQPAGPPSGELAEAEAEAASWSEVWSAQNNRAYYANKKTGETTWTKPEALGKAEALMKASGKAETTKGRTLGGWTEYAQASGRSYYHSDESGETVWIKPAEFEAAEQEELERLAQMGKIAAAAALRAAEEAKEAEAAEAAEAEAEAKAATEAAADAAEAAAEAAAAAAASRGAGVDGAGDGEDVEDAGEGEDAADEAGAPAEVVRGTGKRARREQRRREREAAKAKEMANAQFASQVTVRDASADGAAGAKQTPITQQAIADPAGAFTQMLGEVAERESELAEWEWEDAMRLIITDRRYGAVKTLSQRKDLFAEWQVSQREAQRGKRSAMRREAREAFIAMLCECEEIDTRTPFAKIKALLEHDSRWQALDSKERNAAYDDSEEEMRKVEKVRKAARLARHEAEAEAFLACLAEHQVDADARYSDAAKIDELSADPRWVAMEGSERRRPVFEQYVEAEAKKRRVKARREYDELLGEMRAEGKISRRSRWKRDAEHIRSDARYDALKHALPDAPSKMFERFVEGLQSEHEASVAHAKAVARAHVAVAADTTLESFVASMREAQGKIDRRKAREAVAEEPQPSDSSELGAMRTELRDLLGEAQKLKSEVSAGEAEVNGAPNGEGGVVDGHEGGEDEEAEVSVLRMDEDALKVTLESLKEKLAKELAEAARRAAKNRRRFRDLLETAKDMALSGTSYGEWASVREVLASNAGFELVPDEAEREAMWTKYCAELKAAAEAKGKRKKEKEKKRKKEDDRKAAKKGKGGKEAKKRARSPSYSDSYTYSDYSYSDYSESSSYERPRARKKGRR